MPKSARQRKLAPSPRRGKGRFATRTFQLERLEDRIVMAGGIFAAQGDSRSVDIEWTRRDAAFNNEIGLFIVDDSSGRIGNLNPGDSGYAAAALQRSDVIFRSGQGTGARATRNFSADTLFGVYLVQNSTTAAAKGNPTNTPGAGPITFFSIDTANPDKITHAREQTLNAATTRFSFEDLLGGGDRDYNDAIITIRRKGPTTAPATIKPVISLPGNPTQTVDVHFRWTSRSAAANNEMGLYIADDAQGTVNGIRPGLPGYRQAVLNSPTRQTIFASGESAGAEKSFTLPGGSFVGTYLVFNGTTQAAIQQGLPVYFSAPAANADGFDHLRDLENGGFAWEDLPGGGDRDFNDMVGEISIGLPRGGNTEPRDTTPPAVSVRLANDTGASSSDRITKDPTLLATITDTSAITLVEAAIDSSNDAAFRDVRAAFQNGTLTLDRARLESILGSVLNDREYSIFVRARDEAGNRSQPIPFTFTLDTTIATPTLDLADPFDSAPVGDRQTTSTVVTLTGLSDTDTTITISPGNAQPVVGTDRRYSITSVPLALGGNPFQIQAVDIAGNEAQTTVTITRVEPPFEDETPPTVQMALLNDTGSSNTDKITFDPAFRATVTDENAIAKVEFALGGGTNPTFVDVTSHLTQGNVDLTRSAIESLTGGTLADDELRFLIRATDSFGNQSSPQELLFNLDTSLVTPTLNLAPSSDTGSVGDRVTTDNVVTLLGTTDPGVSLLLEGVNLSANSAIDGTFSFGLITFTIGVNPLSVVATDVAGNRRFFHTTFTREICDFEDNLAGWTTTQSGGSSLPGTVAAEDCAAILHERDSFVVELTKDVAISAQTKRLVFTYADLNFDKTDASFINDAFEVALVDQDGFSLLPTYTTGRDAFFNITEDLPATFDPGGVITASGNTITVNLSSVPIGSQATLVFRLVNNDEDTESSVRLTKARIEDDPPAAPVGTKFYVADATAGVFRHGEDGGFLGSFASGDASKELRGASSIADGSSLWTVATDGTVLVQRPDGSLRGTWLAHGLADPEGVEVIGPDIWVVDAAERKAIRYAGAAANVGGIASPSSSFDLAPTNTSPTGLASDGSKIFVTDDVADAVFVYSLAGTLLGQWSLDPANADASDVTTNPAGGTDLWILDRLDLKVYAYAPGTTFTSGSATATSSFVLNAANTKPEGLADPPPSRAAENPLNATVKWSQGSFSFAPHFDQVMMTPAVIDLDRDDVPDIVFSTFTGSGYLSNGILRAIRGSDGTELWTVTSASHRVIGAAGVAVGDIDHDGFPEIIATHESNTLIAFEHDGTFKWKSSTEIPSSKAGSASLADLDGDGTTEIVIGSQVFRNDGSLLWAGSVVHLTSLSAVADLDLDSSPEVIIGNTAYRPNGDLYWNNSALDEGFVAIGNFDSDAYPEIVTVSGGRVNLLSHLGERVWGPITFPGGGGGAPTIADFDGDNQPEIGIAGASTYTVFETDGSIRWSANVQDLSSVTTGSSVFDFDGDGRAEVIYGDELFLRIYDGADGTELYKLAKPSGTTYEMPLIVDVDNDGSADIVAVANNYAFSGGTGIYVISSATNSWVDTRSIWNQHTYHITNINDDGTIPSRELNSWELYNNYRRNLQPTGTQLGLPSITVESRSDSAVIGSQVLLTGMATADGIRSTGQPNRIETVYINGRPVDVLDPTGRFFALVDVLPGTNAFNFVATDTVGQTAATSVSIEGATTASAFDLSRYADITGTFEGVYYRTSFDDRQKRLYVDLATKNKGAFEADVPLLVGVRNISDPTVKLVGFDGLMPDGTPYVDFSRYVAGGRLRENQETSAPTIVFENPTRERFDYDLVFYAKLNEAPEITTVPDIEALSGRTYRYDVDARDADGDPLTYSFETEESAPTGMDIAAASGLITWSPTTDQIGNHDVVVLVNDRRGGTARQRYVLSVIAAPPNRPPVFTSTPVTEAHLARNLVVNGSFEFGEYNNSDSDPRSYIMLVTPEMDTITGWTVSGARGVHWGDQSLAPVAERNGTTDGNRSIDLQGMTPAGQFSSLSTTVQTTPGRRYLLRFDAAPGNRANTAAVSIGSLINQSFSGGEPVSGALPQNFEEQRYEFVATDSLSTLLFQVTASDGFGPVIDNVSIFALEGDEAIYRYAADAIDADDDSLTYALIDGPAGMTINPITGELLWAPTPVDLNPPAVPVDPSLPVVPGFDVTVYAHVTDPFELAFDQTGNLFVGRDNFWSGGTNDAAVKIHQITNHGATVREYGNTSIQDPDAVTVDATGSLTGVPGAVLVAGVRGGGSGGISAIYPDGSVHELVPASTAFADVDRMQIDKFGRLFFSDTDSGTAKLLSFSSGVLTPIISLPTDFRFTLMSNDRIAVSLTDGTVRLYSSDGTMIDGAYATGLPGAAKLAYSSGGIWRGSLLALASETGELFRIDAGGSRSLVATGFDSLDIIEFGPDQSLYVSQLGKDRILRVSPSRATLGLGGGQHRVVIAAEDGQAGIATQEYIVCIKPDPNNHAPIIVSEPVTTYVSSPNQNPPGWILPNGVKARSLASLSGNRGVGALALGDDGTLYINAVPDIYRLPSTGGFLETVASNAVVDAGRLIVTPSASRFGGDLIVADHNYQNSVQGAVLQVDPINGDVQQLSTGVPSRTIGDPFGLALGPGNAFGNDLYIMDFQGNAVPGDAPVLWKLTDQGSRVLFAQSTQWPENSLPFDIAFSTQPSFGEYLYVADPGLNAIWRVSPNGTISEFLRDASISPLAIRFGKGGIFGTDMYVLTREGAILRVTPSADIVEWASGLPIPPSPNEISNQTPDFVFTDDGQRMLIGIGPEIFELSAEDSSYQYDVNALDPDGDTVTYSLVSGPEGMTFNASSGQITWNVSPATLRENLPSGAFFGEDLNFTDNPTTPADDPLRLAATPQSDAAANEFLSKLSRIRRQDFESIAPGTTGLTKLNIGGIEATITGTTFRVGNETTGGGFSRSGANWAAPPFPNPASFDLTFSRPIAAFGFYANDVGEAGQLSLTFHFVDGTSKDVVVPHSIAPVNGSSISGSMLFYGIIEPSKPFNRLTFRKTVADDGFTYDDFIVATLEDLALSVPVTVRASDNRGGFDEQTFTIEVKASGTGEIRGTKFDDRNLDGIRSTGNALLGFDELLAGTVVTNQYADQNALLSFVGVDDGPRVIRIGNTYLPATGSAIELSDSSGFYHDLRIDFVEPVDFFKGLLLDADEAATIRAYLNGSEVASRSFPGGSDLQVRPFSIGASGGSIRFDSVIIDIVNGRGLSAGPERVTDLEWPLTDTTIPNWQVYLDLNNNAQLDLGEPTTLTDADGNYAFTGLPEGTYTVREVMQTGWTQTAPSGGAHTVTLTDGQIITGLDFGNTQVIAGPNQSPTISDIANQDATAFSLYRLDPVATDPENDPLTYDLLLRPDGMTINPETGTIVWIPREGQLGIHPVLVRVQDGKGGIATESFNIEVVAPNNAPVFTTTPVMQAIVGRPYEYRFAAQDPDGQAITYTLGSGAPAGMRIETEEVRNADGLVVHKTHRLLWEPASVGSQAVTLLASDGKTQSSQTFTINVVASAPNLAPVIGGVPGSVARAGLPYIYAIQASDPDGDILTYSTETTASVTISDEGVLRWIPTGTETAPVDILVKVSDGRGGEASKPFFVDVVMQGVNTAPRIVSNPVLVIRDDDLYSYPLRAVDAEGDPIVWSLDEAPLGMWVDQATQTLRWSPNNREGAFEVVLRATDAFGASDVQSFFITVSCANQVPMIRSTPPTEAFEGERYFYAVRATDPEGDTLTFHLDSKPGDMAINAATGLIQWTPQPTDIGQERAVVIRVEDGRGGTAIQQYKILVQAATNRNRAPVITSSPVFNVITGETYQYAVIASDPDGDTLNYDFDVVNGNPIRPEGMSISPAGVITWNTTGVPDGAYTVSVKVSDGTASARQGFAINVRANRPPEILSVATTVVDAGDTYRYSVRARDVDGDAITYSVQGPEGMTIDPLGRILWKAPTTPPTTAPRVVVTATDTRGLSDTEEFTLTVNPDETAPVVGLQVFVNDALIPSGGDAVIRSNATIIVTAYDKSGISERSLVVDGKLVALDELGRANILLDTVKVISITASAKDGVGNAGSATTTFNVVERAANNPGSENDPGIIPGRPTQPPIPSGNQTPIVKLTAPRQDDVVKTQIGVTATIDDPEDRLWYWKVLTARIDLVDLDNIDLNDPDYRVLSSGTNEVFDAKVATFDATALANDSYIIWVVGYDSNGEGYVDGATVNVEGNAKFGEFKISLTDLSIPLAGIPIDITRVYDSRDAGRVGDFGHGWSLGMQDPRILETAALGQGGALFGEANSFVADKTKVYLTNPAGERVGFTYKVRNLRGDFLGISVTGDPYFQPDLGVYDTLEVDERSILVGGAFFDLAGGFNPDNYTLTTKDGFKYRYNQASGLQRITDPNGNYITFTATRIEHNSGQGIDLVRDARGRIKEVIDPAGNKILYGYDAKGDLVSVTSQANLTSTYKYFTSPAHFLDEAIDANGQIDLKVFYDQSGRFKEVRDGSGNVVGQQDYNEVPQNVGIVRDANGNITRLEYDERGNVEREIDPDGNVTIREYEDDRNPDLETKIIDRRGFITERGYDNRGNVLEIRETGTAAQPFATPIVTKFIYNARNDVTSITNALGQTTKFEYDGKGNLLKITNADNKSSTFKYDDAGRKIEHVDFNGNLTKFVYTAPDCGCSNPREIIFADGSKQKFDYNQFSQVTKEEYLEANGTVVQRREWVYDDQGRLIEEKDGTGNVVKKVYLGDLLDYEIIVNPDSPNETPLTPVAGRKSRITDYDYDTNGRVTKQTDANGGVVNFRYDAKGNRILLQDPVGNITTWVYDKLNRVIEERDSLYWDKLINHTPGSPLAGLTGDALLAAVVAYNQNTPSGADPDNNIGAEHLLVYDYDAEGNRSKSIDRNGRVRTFAYDHAGRLLDELWWQGTTQVGKLSYQYDVLGNMLKAESFDAAGVLESKYVYTYDVLNRQRTVDNAGTPGAPNVILTYGYDNQGNVTSTSDNWGVTVASIYDERNRLKTRSWFDAQIPSGEDADVDPVRVEFKYNAAGRETRLERWADTDNDGQVDDFVGYTATTYDLAGRTDVLSHRNAVDEVLSGYDYDYDFSGLVIKETRDHQDSQFDEAIDYKYDLTGQLTDVDYRNDTQPDEWYRYDLNGNRTDSYLHPKSAQADGASYVTGPGNRLLSDGTFDYRYDHEGNQIKKVNIATGETTTFNYDQRNRLVRVDDWSSDPGDPRNPTPGAILTQSVEHSHDSLGRRTASTVDADGAGLDAADTTIFIYNGNNTWADFDETASPIAHYLFNNSLDSNIARVRASDGTAWYLVDKLGTVRNTVNASGIIVNHSVLSVWGLILSQTSAANDDRFSFTGREFEKATALFHFRTRSINPYTGRFSQQDRLRFEAGDYNLYRYLANSPINGSDPFGEASLFQYAVLAGGLTGAAGGLLTCQPGINCTSNIVTGFVVGTVTGAVLGLGPSTLKLRAPLAEKFAIEELIVQTVVGGGISAFGGYVLDLLAENKSFRQDYERFNVDAIRKLYEFFELRESVK